MGNYRVLLGAQDPWANAMAVRDGRLEAVGSVESVTKLVQDAGSSTAAFDLQGRMVVPVRWRPRVVTHPRTANTSVAALIHVCKRIIFFIHDATRDWDYACTQTLLIYSQQSFKFS